MQKKNLFLKVEILRFRGYISIINKKKENKKIADVWRICFDSSAVNCYIEAVKQLAREILDLTAEGLGVPPHTFSKLISTVDSDSVLRVNHYPPSDQFLGGTTTLSDKSASLMRVGFGEHTDPQILTVLRSNGVGGLQVSNSDNMWVPVSPDPSAFCVNVGDLLQVCVFFFLTFYH